MMEPLLIRTKNILSLKRIREIARTYNTIEYFDPPLNDEEFEKQWKCAQEFVARKTAQERYQNSNNEVEINVSDQKPKDKPKEYSAYKYSKETSLAEQIILGNESVFV